MDVPSPPRYRRFSTRPGPAPVSASELPAYTRRNTLAQPVVVRRESTEHVYHVADGKSRPGITLKVYSSAKSSKSLPTFFEKENINGQLEIHAEKGDSIQAITAIITGRIITGAHSDDSFTFLSHTLPIWAKSLDTPRVPSPSEGTSRTKLLGHCVWPLSIPMPRNATIPTGPGESRTFHLPETFLERHTRVSIQYDFTILISRGKLRMDSQIKTAFGYVPSTRPDAPSLYRQLAYQQGASLPGPSSDPEGWKTLRPVAARGVMFKSKKVEVRCTLSIAKPLCYTRGSVIPCFISIEGADPLLLNLLSSPNAVVLSLRRRVRFYNKTTSSRQDVAWNETVDDMGSAVWWTPLDARESPGSRQLEGEIQLAKDLRPTSEMGHFSISYSVVLCPFNADHFVSDSSALLSEPVEIATMYGKGPRPHAYSPPAYDPVPRQADDFYAAVRMY
ncbi:hypothetical protein BDQ12DRAFT_628002 [Crucibulum laeve]|uniref:Arrestin-like N-terminal domain-containing protein n=1 Tax=Crucibulum laeve TaxID=68775 RepID=A0A5C3MGA9_9AGAR|nr:hypothetical protein BDQ12DRAFT_628002 [Crucibulum laeve]